MDWRDSPMFIRCGLHTGCRLVNQSTTGTISATTFHAALGVKGLLYTRRLHHHKGCGKKLEGKALQKNNIHRGNNRNPVINKRQIYGVCPAEPQVLLVITQHQDFTLMYKFDCTHQGGYIRSNCIELKNINRTQALLGFKWWFGVQYYMKA